MIRTTMTMLALAALTISTSAMAATKSTSQHAKAQVVATAEGSAPATEEAKPAEAKPVKEAGKAHKGHKAKGPAKGKDAPAGEMPTTPAPEATTK